MNQKSMKLLNIALYLPILSIISLILLTHIIGLDIQGSGVENLINYVNFPNKEKVHPILLLLFVIFYTVPIIFSVWLDKDKNRSTFNEYDNFLIKGSIILIIFIVSNISDLYIFVYYVLLTSLRMYLIKLKQKLEKENYL